MGTLMAVSCRHERRYRAGDLRVLVEVGRRSALALENARLYRQASRAVQARDDVLGIVAHDLRSPLSAILIQASILQRPGLATEHRFHASAAMIEHAAIRMKHLIKNLLEVTRLEAGHLSLEPARLSAEQLVHGFADSHGPLAVAKLPRASRRGGEGHSPGAGRSSAPSPSVREPRGQCHQIH